MDFLQIILTTFLSAAIPFGIAKLSGHKQVSQLDFFDYISGITIGSIGAELATELESPWKPLTHYNPGECPQLAHAGNLPPRLANHGYALQVFLTERFVLSEIIGRTVVVHAGPNDFKTQPGGSAGSKIACGQIQTLSTR